VQEAKVLLSITASLNSFPHLAQKQSKEKCPVVVISLALHSPDSSGILGEEGLMSNFGDNLCNN
jgi:hypothetical protein